MRMTDDNNVHEIFTVVIVANHTHRYFEKIPVNFLGLQVFFFVCHVVLLLTLLHICFLLNCVLFTYKQITGTSTEKEEAEAARCGRSATQMDQE